MENIKSQVKNNFTLLERERNIKIMFAAEAGSRAWGLPSKDSDYDIRFIYIQHPKEAFRIKLPPDNLEMMLGDMDIAGWELKKALGLLAKSNAALLEWLNSPVIYTEDNKFKDELMKLAMLYVDDNALIKHYANMAQRCLSEHLKMPMVKLKKYFYCIRPLLAAQYVVDRKPSDKIMPPVDFTELLRISNITNDMRGKIENLYDRKLNNDTESMVEAVDLYILDWILSGIKRFREMKLESQDTKSLEVLDNFLFKTVME